MKKKGKKGFELAAERWGDIELEAGPFIKGLENMLY
jgi:hypothetical protein